MPSFGEEMRRERELRAITLREISEATKISTRYLDALERNDFRPLPGGVFNKGFVRAYAQHIGVDPEAMVNAYLLEEQTQAGRAQPREITRRGGPVEAVQALPRRRLWAVASIVVALVVAGIVVAFFVWRGAPAGRGARGPAPDGSAAAASDVRG
jgi:cytoskeletal protein RodZ